MIKNSTTNEIERLKANALNDSATEIGYSDSDIIVIDSIKTISETDPMRVNMNIIVFCKAGRMQGTLDGKSIEIRRGELLICAPNIIIDNVMMSPDFECGAICINTNGMRHALHTHMTVWTQAVYVNHITKISLTDDDGAFYNHFYSIMKLLLNPTNEQSLWRPYRREVMQSLISCALLGICNRLAEHVEAPNTEHRSADNIFNKFIELLQNSEIKHRPVEDYAHELYITAKYLTVICKKQSEKTAIEWIREYTIADINYYLKNTTLSSKEISHKLGFPNASFFGKYVKEHCGMAPGKYREKLRY